jgi:hypothetical protein
LISLFLSQPNISRKQLIQSQKNSRKSNSNYIDNHDNNDISDNNDNNNENNNDNNYNDNDNDNKHAINMINKHKSKIKNRDFNPIKDRYDDGHGRFPFDNCTLSLCLKYDSDYNDFHENKNNNENINYYENNRVRNMNKKNHNYYNNNCNNNNYYNKINNNNFYYTHKNKDTISEKNVLSKKDQLLKKLAKFYFSDIVETFPLDFKKLRKNDFNNENDNGNKQNNKSPSDVSINSRSAIIVPYVL